MKSKEEHAVQQEVVSHVWSQHGPCIVTPIRQGLAPATPDLDSPHACNPGSHTLDCLSWATGRHLGRSSYDRAWQYAFSPALQAE